MRSLWWVLIALFVFAAHASAQPAPSTNAEIDALQDTARKQEGANDLAGALKTTRKLVDAQRKLSGDDSIYTWRRELDLMSLLDRTGDYLASIDLQKKMLAKAERKSGKESSEVRDALGRLVGTYQIARMFDETEATYQRLLAISKKLFGDKGRLYAFDLFGYGNFLYSRQEFVAAARVMEQSVAILDGLKENINGQLSTLGLLYMQTDQARAKATFDRYIAIVKTQPAGDQLHTIWWVSSIYRHAGRLDYAQPLEKQALAIARGEIARIEKASGPDAAELTAPLFALGGMLMEIGDLAAAEPVLVRSVALQEKLKSFPPYAQLAMLRRKQGRAKEALALFEKAQAMLKGGTGLFSMMGDIYREMGNTKKAEQLYLTAQADLDRQFGKNAVLVTRLHLGLFAVYVAAKQLDKAERTLGENLAIAEKELAFVLASGTEADHLAYFTREANVVDTTISFGASARRPSATRLALTTILRRKGRMLDAAAASRGTLRARLSPDDRKLLDELDAARAKLAKLAVQGSQANPSFASEMAALGDQIQKLEVTLARKNAELGVALKTVELADVQRAIPEGARLVELVNYQPIDVTEAFSATPKRGPRRYAAYVLADKGDPAFLDLGEATPIDTAIGKLRTALSSQNAKAPELAKTVHDLTFGKLSRALGGAKHVLVAPDAALNLVPFAALHDGTQYLVGKYTFTYVTSGRDLLRAKVRMTSTGPVIFADPDFDGPKSSAPAPSRRAREMQGLTWPRLPGTAEEADALAKTIPNATVYRAAKATEATLKGVHSPSILHLATHGFFLTDADATVENPLLRSGLVFAGANALASGADDGVVTALEASGLDLRGTHLVVLSACETGVGKITNGDGVYGLRRAFVIAGAESLVMSLWEVDDAATRDLMAGYYKKLEAGLGRSEALQAIQREMASSKAYVHPYFWASFVAAGDSSPMSR